MLNQFSRTQLLLGAEAMEKLKGARVVMSVRGSSAAAWARSIWSTTTRSA